MMFHDKLKMLGTLAGVVFAVLLSNQQAGTFMGLIYKNVMFVQNCDADIWIAPPGTEAFQPGKPIPESYILQARVVDGVAWAEPLLYGASTIALPSGGAEAVTLVGTKAPGFHGGPWNVVVGDPATSISPTACSSSRPTARSSAASTSAACASSAASGDRQRLHLGPDPVRPVVRVRRVQPRPADHPHAARPDQLRPRRRRPRPRPRAGRHPTSRPSCPTPRSSPAINTAARSSATS
jgi:hypothetical protein